MLFVVFSNLFFVRSCNKLCDIVFLISGLLSLNILFMVRIYYELLGVYLVKVLRLKFCIGNDLKYEKLKIIFCKVGIC